MQVNTSCKPAPLPAGSLPGGGCAVSSSITNVCVEVTGGFCAVAANKTVSINALCVASTTYADLSGANITATVLREVDCPASVFVCPVVPPPSTATGADCAGAAVIVTGVGVVQTVPHPTAVQLVKLCPTPAEQDREFVVLCAPDGTKVAVQNVTPETAPLGTAPTFEAWTLAGAPYAGAVADLVDCGTEQIDVAAAMFFCADGVTYSRTDFWNIAVSPRVLAGSLWQNLLGVTVLAPAGAISSGACAVVEKERPICGNTVDGEVWDFIERTSTANGITTVAYFDPDTSPMVDVTALFYAMRHGGACDCCRDLSPPLRADLQLVKTHSPAQVFAGDTLTYTVVVTNNGPDSADGATVSDTLPAGFALTSSSFAVAGGAAGVTGVSPNVTIATFPPASSVTITLVGTVVGAPLANTARATAPPGVDSPLTNNESTTTPQFCVREEFHELFSPPETIAAVYSTGANNPDTLGFVNAATGLLTAVGTVPGANLNALGLDKSTNNAVFIDRSTGRIFTAYSPAYAITNPSTLQPGTLAAASSALGALDSTQTWYVGGITGSNGVIATISVAQVDPQTGIQTAIPSLTATLNTGANGFDFDFAPNDDLYVLMGLNIYVSTKASGYAGWTPVGSLSGITGTGGSLAYDAGVLRGSSSSRQVWAFDLTTLTTVVTSVMPAGTFMVDMSGAVDPVCKLFYRNTCDNKFYESNGVVEYVPIGTPIAGGC